VRRTYACLLLGVESALPFKSKKQWKWAFAMHKKFAQKWAKETPNYKSLPSDKHSGGTGRRSFRMRKGR
jgi:hypothetical protein